jgi:hypothetical protein
MQIRAITSNREARGKCSTPAIAIDIGFSSKRATCGAAIDEGSWNLTFIQAVRKVRDFAQHQSNFVLILEAPLSACFDQVGNPCARGDFERTKPARWWSLGAGAVTSLAAMHFLRTLNEELRNDDRINIHLIEGFVVGSNSTDHKTVAAKLLEAFRNHDQGHQWITMGHETKMEKLKYFSILEWIGQSSSDCAIVLKPRFELDV